MAFPSFKWSMGPYGIGAMYVRREAQERLDPWGSGGGAVSEAEFPPGQLPSAPNRRALRVWCSALRALRRLARFDPTAEGPGSGSHPAAQRGACGRCPPHLQRRSRRQRPHARARRCAFRNLHGWPGGRLRNAAGRALPQDAPHSVPGRGRPYGRPLFLPRLQRCVGHRGRRERSGGLPELGLSRLLHAPRWRRLLKHGQRGRFVDAPQFARCWAAVRPVESPLCSPAQRKAASCS